ncbi:GyrI-like domain-containing protein [Flavobacterium sp. ARAG 55.4]|uniref:GyrI-like domain-containing protein n=1 Tax=Flavobacterium sp. ARAG 55.4 TaxID=3451357 RepID=UPI003F466AB9
MKPRITTLTEKKLMGYRQSMNYASYNPVSLWQRFMPLKKEIKNTVTADLYSLQQFPAGFWQKFSPDAEFEKWVAVEVTDFDIIPENMETLIIPGGWYAVFDYRGDGSDASSFFESIFSNWIPDSAYLVDDRPHFEILGSKYKKGDPNSEEEVWIPIRLKNL